MEVTLFIEGVPNNQRQDRPKRKAGQAYGVVVTLWAEEEVNL